jgi:hypothetical protein
LGRRRPELSGFLSCPGASSASLGEGCPRARPGKTTARNFGWVCGSVKKKKKKKKKKHTLKFGSELQLPVPIWKRGRGWGWGWVTTRSGSSAHVREESLRHLLGADCLRAAGGVYPGHARGVWGARASVAGWGAQARARAALGLGARGLGGAGLGVGGVCP